MSQPDARVPRDGRAALNLGLADSHCHLDQLPDPGQALTEAAACGVAPLVAVSEDPDSVRAVLSLQRRYPDRVVAGVGLHPSWVVQHSASEVRQGLADLESAAGQAQVIGEVGLDYRWADTEPLRVAQEDALAAQFDLAERWRLPVNLHSRRSQRPVLERAAAFRRRTGLAAQLHWFTQSARLVRLANAEGLFVSVGPTILDSPQALAVALEVADELLLFESDAPVPVSGMAGHPCRVRQVAELLASRKKMALEDLAALVAANLDRFLGRPAPRAAAPAASGAA